MASDTLSYIEFLDQQDNYALKNMTRCDVCEYMYPTADMNMGSDKKRCALCYNSYIAAKEEQEYLNAHPEELARIIALEKKRKERYEKHGIIENCYACLELPIGSMCENCVRCSSCQSKVSRFDYEVHETDGTFICWRCEDAHYDEVCEAHARRYEEDYENSVYEDSEEEKDDEEQDNGGILPCGCIDVCRCS